MFERYTERARRVIFFARYEASQFGSTTIESEHLLLGLLREDKSLADRFLPIDILGVRKEVEVRSGVREKVSTSIDLPLSNECKRILAYAAEEAERLNQRFISTEHILLGILREEKCVAAEILERRGLTVSPLREELARSPMPRQESPLDPEQVSHFLHSLASPALPDSGVVPSGQTAKRIAEAIWQPLYGEETIASQRPLQAEFKHNVWVVTGSSPPESALFAFILQSDGRILSVGRGKRS
jgi:hypothetical protein